MAHYLFERKWFNSREQLVYYNSKPEHQAFKKALNRTQLKLGSFYVVQRFKIGEAEPIYEIIEMDRMGIITRRMTIFSFFIAFFTGIEAVVLLKIWEWLPWW